MIIRKLLTSIKERKMLFRKRPKRNKTLSAVSEKQVGWTVADTDGKEEKERPEQCFLSAVCYWYIYTKYQKDPAQSEDTVCELR